MANSAEPSEANLLVALDGSHLAETVLPLVRVLAIALKARVTLLHVLEYGPPPTVHGEPHLASIPDAEAYLFSTALKLKEIGLQVETHVHPNPQQDVAASIASHASELEASLIILAAHGRGGFREFFVGRIPQQVAAQAGRPVLIVPAPTKRDLSIVRKIMFPIDLAGEAIAAQPLAKSLATDCHAELILVTVVPLPGTGNAGPASVFLPQTSASLLNWTADQSRNKLLELAMELEEEGLTVITDVRRGDPASELGKAIGMFRADLVIMATHARVGLEGLLAGSVAPRVAASGLCPVLLVPIQR